MPVESIGIEIRKKGYLFSQPGMRYCQAQALVFSLMKDEVFRQYPAKERKEIENQILEEVRGRMLEEIVLLETVKTLPKNKRAFKLLFPIGEFDMVIQDTDEMTCELYEIKHSNQIERKQIRHLSDEEKLKQTEHEFGTITKRTVLYRGKNQSISRRNYFYVFVTFKYQQTGATILLSMERTASTFQTETVSIDMAIPVYSVLQSNHISGEALQNHVQMNSI